MSHAPSYGSRQIRSCPESILGFQLRLKAIFENDPMNLKLPSVDVTTPITREALR